jgi:hypothetical protein
LWWILGRCAYWCPSLAFSVHKGFEFLTAHGVIPLEHIHGLVAGRRHYSEIVMALMPPVVYEGMPQIMKVKVRYPGLLASRCKSLPYAGNWFSIAGKHLYARQSPANNL